MLRIPTVVAALCSAALIACAPAHDWRELRPEGSDIVVSFPCKPDRRERSLALSGRPLRMQMLVCSVGATNFVLVFADLDDPAAVAPALAELRAAALANLGATASRVTSLQVPGMTPNAEAARLEFAGKRPDGQAMQEQAAFFAHGLRVYQASVLGPALPVEQADTFFAGLSLST